MHSEYIQYCHPPPLGELVLNIFGRPYIAIVNGQMNSRGSVTEYTTTYGGTICIVNIFSNAVLLPGVVGPQCNSGGLIWSQ
jgi:hypothetical protein